MSRYKGRTNTKAIEQAYPHIVEMIVPLGGFGLKLDDMYEWHWALWRPQLLSSANLATPL
jgi:hypothetical protein